MEGNRHLFSSFLHGSIFILAVILGGFGIMGYNLYGKVHSSIIDEKKVIISQAIVSGCLKYSYNAHRIRLRMPFKI